MCVWRIPVTEIQCWIFPPSFISRVGRRERNQFTTLGLPEPCDLYTPALSQYQHTHFYDHIYVLMYTQIHTHIPYIYLCTSHQCRAFSHHSAETGRELWKNASQSQGTKSFPYATAGRFHTSWSVVLLTHRCACWVGLFSQQKWASSTHWLCCALNIAASHLAGITIAVHCLIVKTWHSAKKMMSYLKCIRTWVQKIVIQWEKLCHPISERGWK